MQLEALRSPLPPPFRNLAMSTLISSTPTSPKPVKSFQNLVFLRPISASRGGTNWVGESRVKGRDLSGVLKRYSAKLKWCTDEGSLLGGRAIHGNIIRSGTDPDDHLWVSLLVMYAKCGRLGSARRVFDEMPNRDVSAWTTLIARYAAEGNGSEGAVLFAGMCREGVRPNEHAVAAGVRACAVCTDLNFGKQVHGKAVKLGFLSDFFVGSSLVDFYTKCGEMGLAEKLFFDLPQRNDVCLVALLSGYSQVGGVESVRVLDLFRRIVDIKIRLSKHMLSVVLKCCSDLGDGRHGQMMHSLIVKTGLESDAILGCCLVDMYSKCRFPVDALKAFKVIEDPDVVAWSSIISCLEQHELGSEAAECFVEMAKMGFVPNQFTLASLCGVASELLDLLYGRGVHGYIVKLGFEDDNTVGNALLYMYMKTGVVQDGCKVFDKMTKHDTISWNSLLSGFHSGHNCQVAFHFFKLMLLKHFEPNQYSFISILRTCTSLLAVNFGAQVHGYIIKKDLQTDQFIGTCLIDMYTSSGYLDNARLIFSRLKERDVFTWTVMITGYSRIDQSEEAIRCFREMKRENVDPNDFTFASCLGACSRLAALNTGQQIHSQILKTGHIDDFVLSALVDMYGKCGCLRHAEDVFLDSATRDTVMWNTIICCYSQHGFGVKALATFHRMKEQCVKPDEITFIAVLSACSHASLVEDGQKYFDSMGPIYGITPTMEHYACMVDILSRAGKLEEAKKFIEEMAQPPSALIWQTILGACRMHGNIEMGEEAAEKLLGFNPHTDSTYILLSNIYAAAKRWDDVARIRSLMSTRGVKKEPGCSWIEIAGQVHVFLPHDSSHPKIKEIYKKLDELMNEILLAGYLPNPDYVLHDINDADKPKHLLYHSERIAITYGLLTQKSGTPIRIYKNLRICGDCHNAIKYISRITGREIIVRDVSRFHHFHKGACSCHDFW